MFSPEVQVEVRESHRTEGSVCTRSKCSSKLLSGGGAGGVYRWRETGASLLPPRPAAGGWMYLTLELSVKLSQFDLTVDVGRFFSAPHWTDQRPAEVNNSDFCESTFRSQIHKTTNKGWGCFHR